MQLLFAQRHVKIKAGGLIIFALLENILHNIQSEIIKLHAVSHTPAKANLSVLHCLCCVLHVMLGNIFYIVNVSL